MRLPSRLPSSAGVGFKPVHFHDLIIEEAPPAFVEVHAENYMGAGGAAHAQLRALLTRCALSIHGVGLSIGAPRPLDRDHLNRLAALCARYEPASFSEHLAWSSHGEFYYADLLPLPYTDETLRHVVDHVDCVQETLRRQALLENPATYVTFSDSRFEEVDFLREVVSRTGCGLLLDINNVFVSAVNHGTSAERYSSRFPLEHVREIHLAGHDQAEDDDGAPLLIDAHGSPVADPVWSLYRSVIERAGPLPTLIEWDNNIPDWPTLRAEATAAQAILDDVAGRIAA